MQDWELIDKYAKAGSEDAFAELVSRYVNLVYSAALRAVQGDVSLAEEATQKTFCLLAKKSASLSRKTIVVGWLYKTAFNTARDLLRAETRRRFYEQKAAVMPIDSNEPATDRWEEIAPQLEVAMEALSETDRAALLLRYFEGKPMREVAEALGATEDATKMRVSRAVAKLREQLANRGVATTAAALGGVLMAEAVQAAPAAVAESALAAALGASAGISATAILTKAITVSILQKAAIAVVIALVAIGLIVHHNKQNAVAVAPAQSVPSVTATPKTQTQPVAESADSTSNAEIDAAIAGLRLALNAPQTRHLPVEKIEAAIAAFGPTRSRALPVLMEVFNTPREKRSIYAFWLAAHGIQFLGPDAISAWPELRKYLLRGDFASMNDSLPPMLLALSPDGQIIPDLINALRAHTAGSDRIGATVNQMIDRNPALVSVYHDQIADLLQDSSLDVQRQAAYVLARLPGPKNMDALPVLLSALNLEKLKDPHAYDPTIIKAENTTVMHDGERFDDEIARLGAVQALRDFGPEAESAAPALLEVAKLTPDTNDIRQFALMAAKSVAPNLDLPEADSETARRLRAADLRDRAQAGSASFDELIEALADPESAHAAAYRLKDLGEAARPALPALIAAIDNYGEAGGSYDVVQLVKELAPEKLVDRLAANNLNSLDEVADAIGELGPGMSNALPHLERIFNDLNPYSPSLNTVARAIQRIRPETPQLVFHSDDLRDASSALVKAIYDQNKIRSPVYTAYIRDFSDINQISRPLVIRFAEATKADPELHQIFVEALLKKNPSLAVDLAQ